MALPTCLQIKCIWGISKQPGLPNAFVICLPKMEEAISERPCLDFICFQPTCAVLMRTAAGTIGSLCVQCTVLGAPWMIWWIFQLYPARTLAFRCDSVLPRVRAFPSWLFVLFMGPLWNSSQLRVENFLVLSLSLTKFVGLLLSKIIQPWHIRDQFAVQIQLAILLSVCRSSSCGPT